MNVQEQIKKYITGQPGAKRSDMQELHRITVQMLPKCKLWFLDGKNSEGKTVSNPNIGYGLQTIKELAQSRVSGNRLAAIFHNEY